MKSVILSLLLCISIPLAAQYAYPFQNPTLTPDERLDNLMSLMTLTEKIHALGTDLGVPRLGIRSTGQMEAHKAYKTYPEGVSAIIKTGVGQFLDVYRPYVIEALGTGLLTEKDIEKAIRGNFYVALRLGLLDAYQTKVPYTTIGTSDTTQIWNLKETKDFVRLVTAKSVVLLKNNLLSNREQLI